jgi:hypothetical protein
MSTTRFNLAALGCMCMMDMCMEMHMIFAYERPAQIEKVRSACLDRGLRS